VAKAPKDSQERGLPDSLRQAIERTFEATSDSAADARDQAGELLDEVSRRGREAREAVARRRQKAGEASADAAARVIEAIEGMRLATREDLRSLEREVKALARRVEKLESKAKVEG
jgi:polyhydroxyalkanoate synthesis regulator phasin